MFSFSNRSAGAKKAIPATPKSAEAEARSKAREEARKKLIAAKREAVSIIHFGISFDLLSPDIHARPSVGSFVASHYFDA